MIEKHNQEKAQWQEEKAPWAEEKKELELHDQASHRRAATKRDAAKRKKARHRRLLEFAAVETCTRTVMRAKVQTFFCFINCFFLLKMNGS